jgi:hypothetical protein
MEWRLITFPRPSRFMHQHTSCALKSIQVPITDDPDLVSNVSSLVMPILSKVALCTLLIKVFGRIVGLFVHNRALRDLGWE